MNKTNIFRVGDGCVPLRKGVAFLDFEGRERERRVSILIETCTIIYYTHIRALLRTTYFIPFNASDDH